MADEGHFYVWPNEIKNLVRNAVAELADVKRETAGQAAVDAAIRALHEDGETELAAAILLLGTGRSIGALHEMLRMLWQCMHDTMVEMKRTGRYVDGEIVDPT